MNIIDPWFYRRPELTRAYGTFCSDTLFSRMVFLGSRRIGKTSFFLHDLSPHLIELGMTPIYISMWGNKNSPHIEFVDRLTDALDELSKEGAVSRLLKSQIHKLAVGNQIAKMEVEFSPSQASDVDLSNIKVLLDSVVEKAGGAKVVLILDEFQHLVTSTKFENFQYSLRTLLDTLGTRLTVIYTGSSRTGIKAAFEDKSLPFYQSATVQEFPMLDDGFITHCTGLLKNTYGIEIDRLALLDFWNDTDHSPHWTINLMRDIVNKKVLGNSFSLASSIEFIHDAMCEEESHTELLKSMSKTDKAVYLLKCSGKGIYAIPSFEFITSVGGTATRSAAQSSEKKLLDRGFISALPNGKVISEIYGLKNAVRKDLNVDSSF